MSTTLTRKERRAEARAQRHERERAAAERARRRKRLIQLGTVVGVAAIAIAIAVAISQSGGGGAASKVKAGQPAPGAAAVNARFAGIPQNEATLGSPRAPATLVEFADLQCPFCREFTVGTLPTLVDRYVRTGKLQIQFRPVSFIGPDSMTAAGTAVAAGQQNRLWQFVDLFYANQGEENTGYVTDSYLTSIARGVQGLDTGRALANRRSAGVTAQLAQASALASRNGVDATPTFLLGRTGTTPQPLATTSLGADAFTGPIDRLVRS
jgi:protein-disulfide isomerase